MPDREQKSVKTAASATDSQRTVPLDRGALRRAAGDDPLGIPGYRALRRIGEGGMAQVYLAERIHDGLQLVLKVLDAELRQNDKFLRRFVREYKLLASLEAEHVARIYDQGFAGEHPYIAMEYLPGGTLATRIHEGIASREALRVVSQIARSLAAIHEHGVVHRDLKPQNIMFRADGEPVIVDFGLSKDLASRTGLTQQGEVLATPRYMSPEQCLGLEVDARSDLYSLGVIFYEMLAGHRLYEGSDAATLVYQHVHAEPAPLPGRLAGYQPIVDKLLAKRPWERFQSARELFATIAT